MLGGNNAPQVAFAKAPGPPIVRLRNEDFVPELWRINTGHAQQVRCILPGHCQPALAASSGHEGHLGIELQRLGFDGPGLALVVGRQLQNARIFKGQQSLAVHLGCQALDQHGLVDQHGSGPSVVPGGAPTAGQFVKARLRAQGQEHRSRCVLSHLGHPFRAAPGFDQGIDSAVPSVGTELGVHHPTASAHVRQGAPQPLGHRLQFEPMRAKLFAITRQQVGSHRLHHVPGHRQRGLARALQGSSAVALVSHLTVGLPEQSLLHFQRQAALSGQMLLFLQLHRPIALPHHVRRYKL